MPKSVIVLPILILLLGCTPSSHTPLEVVEGYFYKNQDIKESPYYITITTASEFEAAFGVAKTMDNTPTAIAFNQENVVGIIYPPNEQQRTLEVLEVFQADNQLKVQYRIKEGAKQSYSSGLQGLWAIPKNIVEVTFIQGKESKTLKIPQS